jgi:hypothetical protein
MDVAIDPRGGHARFLRVVLAASRRASNVTPMMAERKGWPRVTDILVWSGKDDAMLFEELRPADKSTLSASPERQLLVEALLADFRRAYPVIEFSVVPEFNFLVRGRSCERPEQCFSRTSSTRRAWEITLLAKFPLRRADRHFRPGESEVGLT